MSAKQDRIMSMTLPEPVWPQPEDYPKMSRKIAGWACFGLAARALQLAFHQRPLRSAPHIYAYGGAFWGFVGYGVYNYERRIKYLLARKQQQIREYRETEKAQRQGGAEVAT